jgi:hypothetical protein
MKKINNPKKTATNNEINKVSNKFSMYLIVDEISAGGIG